jgi:hypothetical protein
MRFARWIFLLAGISGIVLILPLLFLEHHFVQRYPPEVNHPELYYGFFGVVLAWQIMFVVIASDPVRYRLAMLPSLVEKASFALAVPALCAAGRIPTDWLGFAALDGTWLILFSVSFFLTPKATSNQTLH